MPMTAVYVFGNRCVQASTYALSAPIMATVMTAGMPGRIWAPTKKNAPKIPAHHTMALRVSGFCVASMKYLR